MDSPLAPPIIVTLSIEAAAQRLFNELRKKHFPPERNYLDAHLTLFHHLPGEAADSIAYLLMQTALAQEPFTLQASGMMSLGRGVAYRLESDVLATLHRQLQQQFAPWLTPQDAQRIRPHITIQNKVQPAAARALLQQLAHDFRPFSVAALGFRLWHYRNGPWEHITDFAFRT